jgi:hypothetical protein
MCEEDGIAFPLALIASVANTLAAIAPRPAATTKDSHTQALPQHARPRSPLDVE